MSYIFGGNTGATPEQIAKRRAIADAMSEPLPSTLGEGLTALGEGFAERAQKNRDPGGGAFLTPPGGWGSGGYETPGAIFGGGGAATGADQPHPYDLASYLVAGKDPSHLQFASSFGDPLSRFLAESPGIKINSGYRSPERQAVLYANAVRKYGSEAAARKWVAPPNHSMHNKRLAADLWYPDDAAREWAHANARRYGLGFRMGHEPWHIEPWRG